MDNRRLVMAVSVLMLFLAAVGPAGAGELRVERARLVGVTVYPDRADVTRQAAVTVPVGASEVVFEKIPPAIERDSPPMASPP
jgi:hypothetical protein